MGTAQSLLSSQNFIAAILLVGVVASVWYKHGSQQQHLVDTGVMAKSVLGKKGKKRKPAAGKDASSSGLLDASTKSDGRSASPDIASLSEHTIPGGIPESGADVSPSKLVKEKRKKGKKSAAVSANSGENLEAAAGPSQTPTPQPADRRKPTRGTQEEAWTRVEARRKTSGQHTTSDAGITTTTSMEEEGSTSALDKSEEGSSAKLPKTFVEKMLPKGRKTAVDDMLETSHYPEVSRVMRITPGPGEKPATGFSWGDYEDVEEVRGADADGEDDGGWGIVKSRGRAKHPQSSLPQTPPTKAPDTMTKKQRQRAEKQAAAKLSKQEADAARLATFAKHKREKEQTEIAEMYKRQGKKVSGGMTSSVDSMGHLVWDA